MGEQRQDFHGVMTRDRFRAVRAELRELGRKLVFTNGCFDLIHPGHVSYLEKARACGDALVVAVNSDESVRRLKGPSRPVIPLAERMELLAALEPVDYVVSFAEDTPFEIIREITPDVLVKGADWAIENIVGRDIVEAAGGECRNIELRPGHSTSAMIEKMRLEA